MDAINYAINYILDFAAKSEATYHVNPWIFCILFFGSALPLYYGYYRIARSALKFENRKLKRKDINHRELKIGITISVIAWWIPYIYVIIFGRLPMHVWAMFYVFIAIMGVFFVKNLKSRIAKSEK